MTNILFWNTHNNIDVNPLLINAILENNCDIVVLAEYKDNINGLCNELLLHKKDFRSFIINCDRIKIAADFEYKQEMIFDNDYVTIQNIKKLNKEFLLMAVHLPSKMYAGEDEQRAVAAQILPEIQKAVADVKHNNVVIVGDFNANPFEKVCINADCFHAVPNKNIAKKRKRSVNKKEYNIYYNPMWNFFGDNNNPNGTYYYPNSGINTYFWNIFDQVLLSPDIANNFDNYSMKILKSIDKISLLDKSGIPDKKISDHLPIFFKIREELF